jgi:hypothetical protein
VRAQIEVLIGVYFGNCQPRQIAVINEECRYLFLQLSISPGMWGNEVVIIDMLFAPVEVYRWLFDVIFPPHTNFHSHSRVNIEHHIEQLEGGKIHKNAIRCRKNKVQGERVFCSGSILIYSD